MAKFIHFIDDRQRDAQVTFSSLNPKARVRLVDSEGDLPQTKRMIKASAETQVDALCDRLVGSNDAEAEAGALMREIQLADHLISGDPEVDMELHGKFISHSAKVYVDPDMKPVFRVNTKERIYNAQGEMTEERLPKVLLSNISEKDMVRWSGKMLPKKAIVQKVLLTKKYQVKHVNGLTFSFLFDLAKKLDDAQALMPVGAGEKGVQPLVMSHGGKPYRAFLEGRVREDAYCLLLHLTDQELLAPAKS